MTTQATLQKQVEKLKEATGAKPKRELHVTLSKKLIKPGRWDILEDHGDSVTARVEVNP